MRYSKQRSLILDIVKSNHVHPAAEWVYEQARKEMPTIGIATVYRNLNQLAEAGEIRKLTNIDGVDRYDGCTFSHYHLKCSKCGRLLDLQVRPQADASRVEELLKEIFAVEAEDITVSSTLLEGICKDCSGRK